VRSLTDGEGSSGENPFEVDFNPAALEASMIPATNKDGRVFVCGTVSEWVAFLERLDPQSLLCTHEADRARGILIVASAVPPKGAGNGRGS